MMCGPLPLLAAFLVELLRVQHNLDVAVGREVGLRGLLDVFGGDRGQRFFIAQDVAAIVARRCQVILKLREPEGVLLQRLLMREARLLLGLVARRPPTVPSFGGRRAGSNTACVSSSTRFGSDTKSMMAR